MTHDPTTTPLPSRDPDQLALIASQLRADADHAESEADDRKAKARTQIEQLRLQARQVRTEAQTAACDLRATAAADRRQAAELEAAAALLRDAVRTDEAIAEMQDQLAACDDATGRLRRDIENQRGRIDAARAAVAAGVQAVEDAVGGGGEIEEVTTADQRLRSLEAAESLLAAHLGRLLDRLADLEKDTATKRTELTRLERQAADLRTRALEDPTGEKARQEAVRRRQEEERQREAEKFERAIRDRWLDEARRMEQSQEAIRQIEGPFWEAARRARQGLGGPRTHHD
jgi:chromosome segregation ATPase